MTITLLQGDCLELMRTLPAGSVDAVVTDPPYDERTHKGAVTETVVQGGIDHLVNRINFDPLVNQEELVGEFLRLSKRWVLAFCTFEDMGLWRDAAWNVSAWVRSGVWDRVNPAPQFSGDRPSQAAEGIAIIHNPSVRKRWNGGGKPAIWRYPVERGNKLHPTQKPLKLMKALITDFTDPDETILDPFAGAGTTAIACLQTGRNFIGMERDPIYFAIAEKRIRDAQQQMMLPLEPVTLGDEGGDCEWEE